MWFIGAEVAQETSAPPPKKILDPPLQRYDNQRDLSIKKTLKCKNSKQNIVKTRLVLIYTYISLKKKKKNPLVTPERISNLYK